MSQKFDGFFSINSQFTNVDDNLYLTSMFGITSANIKKHRIAVIVNTTVDVHTKYSNNILNTKEYRIPVCENDTKIQVYFDKVINIISENLSQAKAVVVHCDNGDIRSLVFIAAYLIKAKDMSTREAIEYLCKKRNCKTVNDFYYQKLSQLRYVCTRKPCILETSV